MEISSLHTITSSLYLIYTSLLPELIKNADSIKSIAISDPILPPILMDWLYDINIGKVYNITINIVKSVPLSVFDVDSGTGIVNSNNANTNFSYPKISLEPTLDILVKDSKPLFDITLKPGIEALKTNVLQPSQNLGPIGENCFIIIKALSSIDYSCILKHYFFNNPTVLINHAVVSISDFIVVCSSSGQGAAIKMSDILNTEDL